MLKSDWAPKLSHLSVLELGSGSGFLGISLFLLGARSVLLTDLPPALPLLSKNAQANSRLLDGITTYCQVSALDWSSSSSFDHTYDLVVCSDCIYDEDLHSDLISVMMKALEKDAKILVSWQKRNIRTEEHFLRRLRAHYVILSQHQLQEEGHTFEVIEARRQEENRIETSHFWIETKRGENDSLDHCIIWKKEDEKKREVAECEGETKKEEEGEQGVEKKMIWRVKENVSQEDWLEVLQGLVSYALYSSPVRATSLHVDVDRCVSPINVDISAVLRQAGFFPFLAEKGSTPHHWFTS